MHKYFLKIRFSDSLAAESIHPINFGRNIFGIKILFSGVHIEDLL